MTASRREQRLSDAVVETSLIDATELRRSGSPDIAQVLKINSIYECRLPLNRRAPHRRGADLRVGHPPERWPIMVQGPLGLNFERRIRGFPAPQIENSAITARYLGML